MDASSDYGIVANVIETDRVFRSGAKAWIAGGTGGQGLERFIWIARSRSGRTVEKWAPTVRFGNFRAKWIPDHIRQRAGYLPYLCGTKEEMERMAARLNAFVVDERARHPNRRAACGQDVETDASRS